MSLRKKRGLIFADDLKKINCNIAEYNNNRYINVQGPVPSRDEIGETLNFIPKVKAEDRLLSNEERKHRLNYTSYFHSARIIEIKLVKTVMSMQNEGYLCRDNNQIVDIDSDEYQYLNRFIPRAIGIFGASGCGKTTIFNKIQEMYYEGIIHLCKKDDYTTSYRLQIPMVKVNIPANCTVRAVCIRILTEIDKVANKLNEFKREGATKPVDNNYESKYHFPNVEALLRHVEAVIKVNAIGILALDEVHNIRGAKTADRTKLLNFFVELSNEVKVPLVFIGTEDAVGLFTEEFQNGRRLCTEPPVIFSPFKFNGEWELFLNNLFSMQWIKKPLLCGKEVSAFLYEMSHGIPDVVVKVFKGAQENAIDNGSEEISIEAFIKEYQKRCILIDRHLTQMDAWEVPYRLENIRKKRKNKRSVSFTSKPQTTTKKVDEENNNEQQLIQTLVDLGYSSKESETLSKNAIAHLGENTSVKEALKIILAGYKEDKPTSEDKKGNKVKKEPTGLLKVYNELDKNERKDKRLIYEALKENGYIARESEFLF